MNREYREYFTQLERVDDLRDQPTDPAGGMANDLALHLSRARKQFFPILLERRKYLLYPDFWLDRQENSHAFLLLAHQWRFLETQFLNRKIKRLNRLLADRGLRVRAVPDEHMPPWIQRDESLSRFHADLSQTRNPEYLIRPGGRDRWMITGFPARHLEGFNLFLFAPMRPLETRLATFVVHLELVAGLLFVFALLLAWFFASLLLAPLNSISTGIQRLSQGVLNQPVSVVSGDILERIGKGINDIMEELRQLLSAGEVQQQLFPRDPLTVKMPPAQDAPTAAASSLSTGESAVPESGNASAAPAPSARPGAPGLNGLVCRGWIPQKTDLFREYYDYLLLPGQRVAFWLVQAHGSPISGALGLGNSKMALRLLFQHAPASPAAVLEEYRRRFPEVVSGSSSGLRLLVGLAHLDEGRVCLANPDRFPVMNGRTGKWLPVHMTPARTTLTATVEQEFTLDPGDQICVAASPTAFEGAAATQVRLELVCPTEPAS